jgi:hypothetical protein
MISPRAPDTREGWTPRGSREQTGVLGPGEGARPSGSTVVAAGANSIELKVSYVNQCLFHASAQQMPRGMERVCVVLGTTADA